MKIFAISDLHISTNTDKPMDVFGGNWIDYLDKIFDDWNSKVSDDDFVLIGGDISWAMDINDAKLDLQSFSHLKGKKILIKGNHDYWWSGIGKVRDILPENFYALQNDSIRFDGFVVCGSRLWSVPGSPNFTEQDLKLYNRERERLILSLKNAKKTLQEGDKLIALMHFPPFNVHREDNEYTKLFEEYGVDAVVYGHLHGKSVRADHKVIKNGVTYYLTSCDQVNNQLTEIVL
jgi:predicted phosphohydrolase